MDNLILDWPTKGVARLTLSQPKRRNAISADMWAQIPKVLNELVSDQMLRALIVRGDGDHFAAGADISEFETLYATPESAAKISADIQRAFGALAAFPVPTIAMIRGACVGGGCGLALCCDLRFADSTSKFAITPAKLGLIYPFGDIARLIDAVGVANAKDLLLSARVIKAKRARRIGLIHETYGVDDLEAKVMAYTKDLLARSSHSQRTMKSLFRAYQAGQRDNSPETDALFLDAFGSEDFQEGYRAFLEKRKPSF